MATVSASSRKSPSAGESAFYGFGKDLYRDLAFERFLVPEQHDAHGAATDFLDDRDVAEILAYIVGAV